MGQINTIKILALNVSTILKAAMRSKHVWATRVPKISMDRYEHKMYASGTADVFKCRHKYSIYNNNKQFFIFFRYQYFSIEYINFMDFLLAPSFNLYS